MKKISLFFSLIFLFSSKADANFITVQNLLPNPVTLYLCGFNPSGTSFTSAYVTFPPGPTLFANPSLLPGTAPYADVNGRVTAAFGVCNPFDLGVGSPNIGLYPGSQYVPAGNDCNNGDDFDIIWNEPNIAPYNAVILIF